MRPRQYPELTPEEAEARLAAALAKGRRAVRRVLAGAEMLDPDQVGERLGISAEMVDQLRRAKRLLGLSADGAHWRYPAWQLRGREIMPGIDRVLAAVRHGEWEAYRILLIGHPETGCRTGLEALQDGDVEAVLAVARAQAARAGGAD